MITVPTSTDKTETVLIAAALETIERIGPCNASVNVEKVEDVRITKRNLVIERAKELLNNLTHTVLPDSRDIKDQVSDGVRIMDVVSYGRDRLPAGPDIDNSEEIVVVEGRADVLNLLKCDIKNAIALNGTSVPQTIVDLCKKKTVTMFVDGDRGGDLIIRELGTMAEVDYVVKAPDGKEVEELTKKEIHKALRSRVAYEQVKLDLTKLNGEMRLEERKLERPVLAQRAPDERPGSLDYRTRPLQRNVRLQKQDNDNFRKMLDDLIGTRGAYILDEGSNILGKVPTSELQSTLGSLQSGVHAIVLDGAVTREIANAAEKARVKYLVGRGSDVVGDARVQIVTHQDLR